MRAGLNALHRAMLYAIREDRSPHRFDAGALLATLLTTSILNQLASSEVVILSVGLINANILDYRCTSTRQLGLNVRRRSPPAARSLALADSISS